MKVKRAPEPSPKTSAISIGRWTTRSTLPCSAGSRPGAASMCLRRSGIRQTSATATLVSRAASTKSPRNP